MHEEFIEVTANTVERLISKLHEPVIAVGTTSLRTLETLYWLGLQISLNKNIRLLNYASINGILTGNPHDCRQKIHYNFTGMDIEAARKKTV